MIYGLVSFTNHELLRTYALDLGLYTNASWQYAHLEIPDRSMFRWDHDPLLADHFDLHLILWSPLTYIFGEWTLLVVQVFAILIGAFGVYKLGIALSNDAFLSIVAMLGLLMFYGVFTALAFDFHSNVVASMALPWYFFFLHKKNYRAATFILLFMLMGKENIGLWVGTVSLAALALPFLAHVDRKLLVGHATFAFLWSFIIIGFVMPALDSSGEYHQLNEYAVLGKEPREIFLTLITKPLTVIQAFFSDTMGSHELGTGIKREFYLVLFISGGWALFRKWPFLVMILPLIAQKMLHSDTAKWGLFSQYSIEFAVIFPIAVLSILIGLRSPLKRKVLALLYLCGVVSATSYALWLPLQHSDPQHGDHARLRFFQEQHYTPYRDQKVIYDAIRSIPPGASVTALTPLVPHLINRHELHQFPIMWDDDYVILIPNAFPWPLTDAEYAERIQQFRDDPEWNTVVDDPDVILFERKRSLHPLE